MASFTIAVASVSGSATAPRTAARAHRFAASRVPAGSLGRGSGVAARRAAPPRRRPTARWCSSTTTTASRSTYRRCVRGGGGRVSRERTRASLLATHETPRPTRPSHTRTRSSVTTTRRCTDERKPTMNPSKHTVPRRPGCDHVVVKNDEVTVEQIRAMNPIGVMVGQAGTPEDRHSLEAVKELRPNRRVRVHGAPVHRAGVRRAHHPRAVRVDARQKLPGVAQRHERRRRRRGSHVATRFAISA